MAAVPLALAKLNVTEQRETAKYDSVIVDAVNVMYTDTTEQVLSHDEDTEFFDIHTCSLLPLITPCAKQSGAKAT